MFLGNCDGRIKDFPKIQNEHEEKEAGVRAGPIQDSQFSTESVISSSTDEANDDVDDEKDPPVGDGHDDESDESADSTVEGDVSNKGDDAGEYDTLGHKAGQDDCLSNGHTKLHIYVELDRYSVEENEMYLLDTDHKSDLESWIWNYMYESFNEFFDEDEGGNSGTIDLKTCVNFVDDCYHFGFYDSAGDGLFSQDSNNGLTLIATTLLDSGITNDETLVEILPDESGPAAGGRLWQYKFGNCPAYQSKRK